MWVDNASKLDFLFYEPYAEIISEDAISLGDEPLTIGIFGLWGAGKSTLLKLIEDKYHDDKKVLCININAWMFEGYEDAKSAMMEALLQALAEEKTFTAEIKAGFKNLLKKIDFMKLGTKAFSMAMPAISSIATGNPMPILLSLPSSAEEVKKTITSVVNTIKEVKDNYLKSDADMNDTTTVNTIRGFRGEFENSINDTNLDRIVVLVDDLDRCQPERIIETLEAIKLFLSVNKTTFIIAADENVIQYSIKRKYPPMEDFKVELDKEYIEKLIQIPVTVPELSEKDIQNYLTILVYQKHMEVGDFERFTAEIYNRKLLISEDVIQKADYEDIIANLDLKIESGDEHEKLLKVVTDIRGIVASTLKGNPRQAKRFLNTFVTKKRLAQKYYDSEEIDAQILAKLLVLYKLDPNLFEQLNNWNKQFDTENKKYREMREGIEIKREDSHYVKWYRAKILNWIKCPPVELEKYPLHKYFYLTRDILHSGTDVNSLISEDARKLLAQLGASNPGTLPKILELIGKLVPNDVDGIMKKVVEKTTEGDLPSFIYSKIFIAFSDYRDEIINALIKGGIKPEVNDIPSWKSMYAVAEDKVNTVLENLQVTGKLANLIRGTEGEG